MKKLAFFTLLILFAMACKKQASSNTVISQLYPLTSGNHWVYVDSFFDNTGFYYALDTFTLKATKPIAFNAHLYTPVTNQFDDSIFTLRSTDTSVYLLKQPDEPLLFRSPISEAQPAIINSYHNDFLNSTIFTNPITTTNYKSYKILITQDDGQALHYKQQELYFTPGIGIIKGRDIRKTSTGNLYAYDSYRLIAYSLF
jgi:hypothetical protein